MAQALIISAKDIPKVQHGKRSVKKLFLCAGLTFCMLTASFSTIAQQAGGARPHVELPDEPVRSAIFKNCSACHGIDVYAYNALDRNGWQSLIDTLHKQQRDLEISPQHETLLVRKPFHFPASMFQRKSQNFFPIPMPVSSWKMYAPNAMKFACLDNVITRSNGATWYWKCGKMVQS